MANTFSPPRLCFVFFAAAAAAVLLFCHGFLGTEASHVVVERNLEALQQETTTTPSQIHRTSFHFQPPMNWMNGNDIELFNNVVCFAFIISLRRN